MKKRILAWIALIGFILLLLNIVIFQYQVVPCLTLYVVIVLSFVLLKRRDI